MPIPTASKTYNGVVVSAGKMMKTVKVRIPSQTWNKKLGKYFSTPITHLVSDSTSSAREGDIVAIASGWRTSKHVRHIISSIISPFGVPLSERPKLPTLEENAAVREKKRLAKDVRQASRGRVPSAQRVKAARASGALQEFGLEAVVRRTPVTLLSTGGIGGQQKAIGGGLQQQRQFHASARRDAEESQASARPDEDESQASAQREVEESQASAHPDAEESQASARPDAKKSHDATIRKVESRFDRRIIRADKNLKPLFLSPDAIVLKAVQTLSRVSDLRMHNAPVGEHIYFTMFGTPHMIKRAFDLLRDHAYYCASRLNLEVNTDSLEIVQEQLTVDIDKTLVGGLMGPGGAHMKFLQQEIANMGVFMWMTTNAKYPSKCLLLGEPDQVPQAATFILEITQYLQEYGSTATEQEDRALGSSRMMTAFQGFSKKYKTTDQTTDEDA